MSDIEKIINDAWEIKDRINKDSDKSITDAVKHILQELDQGKIRVAEKINGEWVTHQYIKKAIMLSFRTKIFTNIFYINSLFIFRYLKLFTH